LNSITGKDILNISALMIFPLYSKLTAANLIPHSLTFTKYSEWLTFQTTKQLSKSNHAIGIHYCIGWTSFYSVQQWRDSAIGIKASFFTFRQHPMYARLWIFV